MSRRLVLIVEDSTDLATNLEIACAAIHNVEVRVAPGAEQAWDELRRVSEGDPLVIVTDIRLPGTDGFDLIRRVRGDLRLQATPIVAVSGDGDPDLPEQLAELSVSAFFRKPYSLMAVRSHLEALLDAKSVIA
ncbi:MAG: response regulator [Bryobacterales bacterium]|nr:response regulator [Bryobacterales bacterium]